jgi:hypothetical protein
MHTSTTLARIELDIMPINAEVSETELTSPKIGYIIKNPLKIGQLELNKLNACRTMNRYPT